MLLLPVLRQYGIKFLIGCLIGIDAEIIFFHISNVSDIPLMSILKLFVDTFVSFLKREVIIFPLWTENIVVLDSQMIIQRRKKCKKKKNESEKVV